MLSHHVYTIILNAQRSNFIGNFKLLAWTYKTRMNGMYRCHDAVLGQRKYKKLSFKMLDSTRNAASYSCLCIHHYCIDSVRSNLAIAQCCWTIGKLISQYIRDSSEGIMPTGALLEATSD